MTPQEKIIILNNKAKNIDKRLKVIKTLYYHLSFDDNKIYRGDYNNMYGYLECLTQIKLNSNLFKELLNI